MMIADVEEGKVKATSWSEEKDEKMIVEKVREKVEKVREKYSRIVVRSQRC